MTAGGGATRRTPLDAAVISACFFVSGAAALVFESVWLRYVALLSGSTTYTVTAVLAVFMGGLAVGAWAIGALADRIRRPLRAYALVEAASAAWGLLSPGFFSVAGWALDRVGGGDGRGGGVRELAVACAVLLPPTVLLGGSLPLLARWSADGPRAAGVGRLYAVNTLGGVAGALAAGFLLLPSVGLAATTRCAGGLALLAALAAAWRSARGAEDAGRPEPAAPPPSRRSAATPAAFAAIAVAGAASMAYEIAWTRALAPILSSSTYAFSAMLATWLVGLALGAWLVARRTSPPDGEAALGVAVAVAGLSALLFLPGFGLLPGLVAEALARTGLSHAAIVAVQFGASFAVMIVPATCAGIVLPLGIAACAGEPARAAREVGRIYAVNTLGAVAGCVAAGLGVLPRVGSERTVEVAALAAVAAGGALVALSPGTTSRRVAVPIILAQVSALLLFAPGWDRRLMTVGPTVYARDFVTHASPARALRDEASSRKVLFYDEGLASTVMVYSSRGHTVFTVNGKVDGGDNATDMRTQLLLGHLPALLHPGARRAFVVGLGTGVTAGALAAHPLESLQIAEIEPAMREAAGFFEPQNRGVLRDPRTRLLVGDGRRLLASAQGPFDIITSEPSNPWIAGIGNLFSREFYAAARRRLAPGGVMVQWFHAYSMSLDDVRTVVATFRAEFPHATLWRLGDADFLLVARDAPLAIDPARMSEAIAGNEIVLRDLAAAIGTPAHLPWFFLLDEEAVARFAGGAPLNTDDRPRLEFSAPRSLHLQREAEIVAEMRRARAAYDPPIAGGADRRAFEAPSRRLAIARTLLREGDPEAAAHHASLVSADATLTAEERAEVARIAAARVAGPTGLPGLQGRQ